MEALKRTMQYPLIKVPPRRARTRPLSAELCAAALRSTAAACIACEGREARVGEALARRPTWHTAPVPFACPSRAAPPSRPSCAGAEWQTAPACASAERRRPCVSASHAWRRSAHAARGVRHGEGGDTPTARALSLLALTLALTLALAVALAVAPSRSHRCPHARPRAELRHERGDAHRLRRCDRDGDRAIRGAPPRPLPRSPSPLPCRAHPRHLIPSRIAVPSTYPRPRPRPRRS